MEQGLSLLAPHLGIRVAQNESNSSKEVALAGTIATDNNVVLSGEWFNHSLILVAGCVESVDVAPCSDRLAF